MRRHRAAGKGQYMDKHNQIIQLRERERQVTFFPQGAAAAPQQPVLQEEEEEPLADKIWRLARPGLLRAAFIFGWLGAGVIFVKVGSYLLKVGGLK